MLIISQPKTPGQPPIPAAKTETDALHKLIKENKSFDVTLLKDVEATIEQVKKEMESSSWVHFACHSRQHKENPLQSGVHLHNGCLELSEIIKLQIPNSKFAFLSACHTSKGDAKLSEEVVHIAAGMLAAGYQSVVGTMWSISDAYGPKFSGWFYEYLLDKMESGELNCNHAAYALDHATRKVCETFEEPDSDFALLIWVPYVHFGY